MSMRRLMLIVFAGGIVLGAAGPAVSDDAKPVNAARVLLVTQSAGYRHGVVNRKRSETCLVDRKIKEWGVESDLYRADYTQDVAKEFTKERLANYQIVMFYTTGKLPIAEKDLEYFLGDWLKQPNHGFIGFHCATDTYHKHKPYVDMICGTFASHPWGSGATVAVSVHDTGHPVSKPWGSEFTIKDEIYRFKNWQPEKVRVLMSLDMANTKNKQPYHVPVAWVREYGKGKVFYISLGHNASVWENDLYKQSVLGGVRWILGHEKGDATPNPELSKAQHEKAIADTKK